MSRIKYVFSIYWEQMKNGLFQMLSANVLNKIISMLCNMAVTRLLTKTDFGIWSYVLNIYSYLNLISGFGLVSGAFQFGTEHKKENGEYQYFRYALIRGMQINTFIVVFFLIVSFFLQFSLEGSAKYVRIYIPFLFIDYVLQLFWLLLRCENRVKEYARLLNINSVLTTLGTCLGAFLGLSGIVWGRYISFGISLGLLISKLRPELILIKNALPLIKAQIRSLWHYSIFTGISATLNCILYLLDVSMIAFLIRDSQIVASYKVATLLPNALSFIPTSVVVCILTKIIENRSNREWLIDGLKKTYVGLGVVNIGIVLILFVFAPQIITIISGTQYSSSVPIFRILILGYLVSGTFRGLSVNVLGALKQVKDNLIISISSIVFDVVLNYCFIKRYGNMGAAYATFFTEIIVSIIAMWFLCSYIYRMRENEKIN